MQHSSTVHVVDVIIPTRNRATQTVEAVRSVQSQTDDRWRIFLVDDASDDGSFEELERLAACDDRITLLRHETVGRAARARQTGFVAGSAEWVATLDSDDLWLPDKLEMQLAAAGTHDVVLGWHSWVRPDGSVRVTRRPIGEGRVSPLFTSNVDVALMRRDLVDSVGGFAGPGVLDLVADENIDFFIRLLARADVVVVEQVLALCRDHVGDRTSDAMTPDSLAMIVEQHRGLLQGDPEFASMLCRLGARFLASGERAAGWHNTWDGLRSARGRHRIALAREFLPHGLKASLNRRR